MKCVLKNCKPVIELSEADRRVLRNAKAIFDFVSNNAGDAQLLKESAAEGAVAAGMVLMAFSEDTPAGKHDDKAA